MGPEESPTRLNVQGQAGVLVATIATQPGAVPTAGGAPAKLGG
jgi:hypothetical protein